MSFIDTTEINVTPPIRGSCLRLVVPFTDDYLDFSYLSAVRRRGLRNGNWPRLPPVDRALFRCALWVTKVRGRIVSFRLMVRVLGIALKLLMAPRMRIWRAGRARAEELMRRFEERGLFEWTPNVRSWLVDPSYVFCLGLGELFGS